MANRFQKIGRWLNNIPAEGRVWTQSLYIGLVPSLLCVLSFFKPRSQRKRNRREVWHRWLASLSVLASLGWFGAVWVFDETTLAALGRKYDHGVGPQVGSVYWLMVHLLPGYAFFRYPAKIWCLVTWCIAFLGATQLNRKTSFTRPAIIVSAISGLLLGCSILLEPTIRTWMQTSPGDSLFGPFLVDGALFDLRRALTHGLAISTLLVFGSCLRRRKWFLWVSHYSHRSRAGVGSRVVGSHRSYEELDHRIRSCNRSGYSANRRPSHISRREHTVGTSI